MKKKIKDLTLEEYRKICSRYSFCPNCPLLYSNKCMQNIGTTGYQGIDESEVEIDESNND